MRCGRTKVIASRNIACDDLIGEYVGEVKYDSDILFRFTILFIHLLLFLLFFFKNKIKI
jgi:hypothetical protein